MYLKRIEINGFKSFAKKVELNFKKQISGIVGPNGSGKSNTAEAFRFVLGEQSMKNMRGKKGEDLIFSGKTGRLNRASVKVVFDNKDRALNIDYDEVSIERVVYRDGTNEYLINNSKVRAKDVVELLTGANIGSSGHHIISQGEADKILSISPKDRKSVLEEALGLKIFVLKKQEAERKLEKTEENLKEVKTRERVNAPRIRFLEKEVEKIQRSKELKTELERLYFNIFPFKKKYKKTLEEVNLELKKVNFEKENIEENILLKKEELKNNKNQTEKQSDSEKEQEIENFKIKLEEVEKEKDDLQRELVKNEILIEAEEKKKTEFNSQKEREEENLKFYNSKLEEVSSILHKNWEHWAKSILQKEKLSQERVERWTSRFVEYQNLPEESKEKDRVYAREILDIFGVKKTGLFEENFDQKLIDEKRNRNEFLKKKIVETNDFLESLNKKIRILSSDSENAEEMISQEIQIEILKLEKQVGEKISEISKLNNQKIELLKELQFFDTEETHIISIFGHQKLQEFFAAEENPLEENLKEKITRTRIILENNGVEFSENLLEEYNQLKEAQEFVKKEIEDLEKSKKELLTVIADVEVEIEKRFRVGVEKVNSEFSKFFSTLFMGGKAELVMVKIPIKKDDDSKMDEFDLGLDVKVSLPNKKISGLGMLSGGERSLTSIALLFAMSSITPPPFIILDETDAALDEANSKRYGDMIEKLSEHSQLILITHNRETMSRAGLLYGVTMDKDGVSKLLSISFDEGERFAK